MAVELDPLHRDLAFMTPLSAARADQLVDFVSTDLGGVVADVGCGWGELLLRVLETAPGAHGIGLDLDAEAVEHGRALARSRGLDGRVELIVADAKEKLPGDLDAAVCIGASQAWGTPAEDDQPLDYAAALAALRARLRRGGRLVYGEGIWSAEPTAAAMAPLAGRHDEFVRLPELVEIAVAQGFAPMAVHEASQDEWDVFESGYAAAWARWLAEHPADHPEAAGVREQAAAQRAAYFNGYRGVLGMAYLCLVAV